ncbi:MAG: sigma-70 family RNA polymerase sigma factor [Planctomycetes bacterium]|nr:sigma-70 family RNA polymerase sigma factor [Planctomycetota bacterium]
MEGRRTDPDDVELVRRALKGDSGAFSELVERHFGAAFAVARSRLANREDALDAVQDAFARAFEKLAELRQPERFFFWLREIVVRRAADKWDSEKRRERAMRALSERATRPDPGRDPEGLLKTVLSAIDGLPESYQRPLYLFWIEERSYAEIARETGQTVGAIRGLLFRGNKALREGLRPLWEERREA